MKEINDLKTLKEVFGEGGDLFIRWSRGEQFDKAQKYSRDYVSGTTEPGLSAVRVERGWSPAESLRRLKEYAFLRLKDPDLRPYIYRGRQVGVDSDGYPAIEVMGTHATVGDDLLRAIDGAQGGRLPELLEAVEKADDSRARLGRITDPFARQITERELTAARVAIESLLREHPHLRPWVRDRIP